MESDDQWNEAVKAEISESSEKVLVTNPKICPKSRKTGARWVNLSIDEAARR